MENIKAHFGQIIGSIVSGTGAVAAWQTQLDWALRVGASLIGIIVGLLTIRSLLRSSRKS